MPSKSVIKPNRHRQKGTTGMLIFRMLESHFEDIDFFAELEHQEKKKKKTKLCAVSGLATVCENDLLTIIYNISSCLLAKISLH